MTVMRQGRLREMVHFELHTHGHELLSFKVISELRLYRLQLSLLIQQAMHELAIGIVNLFLRVVPLSLPMCALIHLK